MTIGNKYLKEAFQQPDRNTGLCYLLDLSTRKHEEFLSSVDIEEKDLNEQEKEFVTLAIALLSYSLPSIPTWFLSDDLRMKEPFFFDSKVDGIDKIKVIINTSSFCKLKNVYVTKESAMRI